MTYGMANVPSDFNTSAVLVSVPNNDFADYF
jgi:hypothetical protein